MEFYNIYDIIDSDECQELYSLRLEENIESEIIDILGLYNNNITFQNVNDNLIRAEEKNRMTIYQCSSYQSTIKDNMIKPSLLEFFGTKYSDLTKKLIDSRIMNHIESNNDTDSNNKDTMSTKLFYLISRDPYRENSQDRFVLNLLCIQKTSTDHFFLFKSQKTTIDMKSLSGYLRKQFTREIKPTGVKRHRSSDNSKDENKKHRES